MKLAIGTCWPVASLPSASITKRLIRSDDALAQIPGDKNAPGNIEARGLVNDLIDRLELAAQSTEGRKNTS